MAKGRWLKKLGRGAVKLGKAGARSGLIKGVAKSGLLKSIPYAGAIYTAVDIGSKLGAFGGGSKGGGAPGLPALTGGFPGAGLPAVTSPSTGPGGFWWRGPGGKMQLPWNDPKVHESLKPFSLDDSALRVYYRAPRGYVVVRDDKMRPYPLRKDVARRIGWWRPGAKPPMNVTEWSSLKRANKVVRTLKRMNSMAKRVANFDPRRTVVIDKKGGKK